MRIIMNNHTWEMNRSEEMVDELLLKIERTLDNDKRYFSHIIVEGKEVYDDIENYLAEHITSIETIEIITKSINQFIDDILGSIREYFGRALPEIVELANEFYQNPQADSWDKLAQLVDAISWIWDGISQIDKQKQLDDIITNHQQWNEMYKEALKLSEVFVNMDEGMKNQDYVLIADILTHEIHPSLRVISEKLSDIHVQKL